MAKLFKNKIMKYNDSYYGDISLDVPRISCHAICRAEERGIPVPELLKKRSYINAYTHKVVSKNGTIITTYRRRQSINQKEGLPINRRRYAIPPNGIGLFIGKQHVNIKRTQAKHNLKELYFDANNTLIAIAPTSDYDWTEFENMIKEACQRKYKSPEQIAAKKTEGRK